MHRLRFGRYHDDSGPIGFQRRIFQKRLLSRSRVTEHRRGPQLTQRVSDRALLSDTSRRPPMYADVRGNNVEPSVM